MIQSHSKYQSMEMQKSRNLFTLLKLLKSTLDQLKSRLSNNRQKRSASFIYDNACEPQQNGDYGDYPRSKKQLIDISYFLEKSNAHEVGDLLALNYELQDNILEVLVTRKGIILLKRAAICLFSPSV